MAFVILCDRCGAMDEKTYSGRYIKKWVLKYYPSTMEWLAE